MIKRSITCMMLCLTDFMAYRAKVCTVVIVLFSNNKLGVSGIILYD